MMDGDVSMDSTKNTKSVRELLSMFEKNITKPARASIDVIN